MLKELLISVVIVISIIIGNGYTQNYTNDSIEETSNNLKQLRQEVIKDDINYDLMNEQIDIINSKWDIRHDKLAYYIEHDELEKVKTELTSLKGSIQKEEDSEALQQIDKSIYILEHIRDKNSFNLRNIF